MPLFFNLDNDVVHRLQANDGGFEPIPLGEGYCLSGALWTAANSNSRKFWTQSVSNGSYLPLVFELRPHYGRLLTTVLVKVQGQGYTIMPTWMPRVQLLAMNASTSTYATAWTVVAEEIDAVTTVGAYNAAHYIAVSPNVLINYGMRYAVGVFADMSTTASMLLEGIQVGYAFTA
jgi:hypothetical protein